MSIIEKEKWTDLPEDQIYQLYLQIQRLCRYHSWVYYNNNGIDPMGRSITDYTFDMMYNRIRYCEKRFPHFIDRITKEEGGTITNYVGHNMCSLGGKEKIPAPPEIDQELFVYKTNKRRRG